MVRGIRFRLRSSGLEAIARLLGWAVVSAFVLGWSWITAPRLGAAPRRDDRRAARVTGVIRRLVAHLGALKGAFAKAGQFASLRHDVLPAGAAEALAGLRDHVPPLPFPEIRAHVEQELGMPLAAAFRHVERQPLGAASIAQVHRATLHDGREVVVKVQYPWIRASLPNDLAVLRAAAHVWLALRPRRRRDVDLHRFFDEFAAGLRDELDFEREAAVAGEIAANLAAEPQVVVPEVVHELTRARVLTMIHHPCVNIADAAGLRALGVRPADVLEVLARAYAKQVFVDGLFHADPHPGNLFVIDEPGAAERPRVLFVDFGLSRRLDPQLRRAMRQGIYALLQRDGEAFVARMDELGMIAEGARPGVRAAVDAMLVRIADQAGTGGLLGASGGQVLALKDEAKALLQDTPGLQLPNDLLLYAKTLAYLFALGDALDPQVDLMKRSLPYLMQFLAGRD